MAERRKTGVSRREFLHCTAVAGALGAAGAHALTPRRANAQGKGKARLAYLQLGWAATEIIHKEDLLGKRGWSTEYTVVPGSPPTLVNAYAAKNVDAIDMSFALTAKMFEDKIPLRMTGVATAVLGAIVARKDVGLTKVEELKGRKIGAVLGSTTFFDIRTLILKAYRFDIEKETRIVAGSPPDMATLIAKKEVDAIIAWQPISDQVVVRGDGVYLTKQIDLWRKATGRATGFPVHVCYIVNPDFLEKNPTFARDLNDAQQEAVEIFYNKKERAIQIMEEITKIPRPVLEYAHGQTVRMLSGLSDEQVETLVLQLKMTKESGFLKADIWDNPERIKKEFLWRG